MWLLMSLAAKFPRLSAFYAKNIRAAEIHRQFFTVYGQNMSEGILRAWRKMFKDWRPNKCSRWRVKWTAGHLLWVMVFFKILPKNLWKTELHNFRTLVRISTNFTYCCLRDYRNCARMSHVLCNMSSENAHGCAQNAENGFGFDFSQRYHKDGDEFLNTLYE
jgi:hypothetical protein